MLLPPRKGIVLPSLSLDSSPNKSRRAYGAVVRLIVLHDPEGSWEGTDATILGHENEVSYHVLIDDNGLHPRAKQYVPWSEKAWSCAAFNSESDNLSLVGYAAKGFSDNGLRVLARSTAKRLKDRDLPPTFVPSRHVVNGRGFTFHSELGLAGGGHRDPGLRGARKTQFIALVKWEYRRGNFRPSWGEA